MGSVTSFVKYQMLKHITCRKENKPLTDNAHWIKPRSKPKKKMGDKKKKII